ncbi:MAG TPA: DUF805 domain-containing protein [Longimicrobiales bacterium]|nr:DUF805 domain-containing protein [Longimicrobiales bacterium]
MDKFFDLFTFDGRANRAWYFWHIVLDDLVIFTLVMALGVLATVLGSSVVVLLVPFFGALLGVSWAAIAITVRRLHDLGRPGRHWWLLMVPLYNFYLGLVLLLQPGTPGPNRYGTDPLAAARAPRYLGVGG